MRANKVTSCLVIVLVLAVLVDSTIANDTNSVQENEASTSSTDQAAEEAKALEIVVNINNCLERCDPQDSVCPAQCVLNEVATQKVLLEQLITEDRKAAQGIFCMVGCEASQLCHDVNTLGEFL